MKAEDKNRLSGSIRREALIQMYGANEKMHTRFRILFRNKQKLKLESTTSMIVSGTFLSLVLGCAGTSQPTSTSCEDSPDKRVYALEDSLFVQRWTGVPLLKSTKGWKEHSILTGLTYPTAAEKNGIEGYVILKMYIDSTGKVQDNQIIESCPGEVFNQAASNYLSKAFYTSNGPEYPLTAGIFKKRFNWEISK